MTGAQPRPADQTLLDNMVWHTLSGAHAHLSVGTAAARRYASGLSPIIGFADPDRPAFADLEPHCAPGEHLYSSGWSGPAPAGWQIELDTTMHLLVWDAPAPGADDALAAQALGPAHVPLMQELVALTKPGPFNVRTRELGDYFGVFDGERLVAMAGERMAAGPYREVSAVCTHPAYQGRGLARRLVALLVRRELARGETPVLHVTTENTGARRLYERMGFRHYRRFALRGVARKAS